MISVDGDMSTNDAVYAFAPRRRMARTSRKSFRAALRAVCLDLARAMVADGEGATKTIDVARNRGTRHRAGAHDRASDHQQQPRKTALYGEDPNWGRIVAAAGVRAPVSIPVGGRWRSTESRGSTGGVELLSEAEAHRELESDRIVALDLRLGSERPRRPRWGCDLSRDYVRINASYRT